MRKLISALAVLLLSPLALAGSGYHAGFTGVPDICASNMRTHESTVAEYCGNKIDGIGDWKDASGANLLQWSEALDNAAWTKATVTVTADQVRLRDGTLGAEKLEPTAADSYLHQDVAGTVGQKYFCLFDIRSETGNVSLSIHAYDQAHGTILGTQAVTVTPRWQLFRVEGTLVTGDTHVGCTIGGNSTWSTGENIYAGRAWLVDEDVDSSFGVYHPTNATTKPRLDLAQSGSPTNAKAPMQGVDGNRIEAREFNGTDQYYSKAHHDSMNINDQDHTYTFAFLGDSTLPSWRYLFCHGAISVDGFLVLVNGSFHVVAYYSSAGSTVAVPCPFVAVNDDIYHTVQIVRDGNFAACILDGTSGASTDVTGEGIDANRNFRIGARGDGVSVWDGQISYTRIDAEALSAEERAYDREVLLGTVSNQRTNALSVTRATTAYTEFDGASMAEIAPNLPRIGGPGGGLLIEGQGTNLIKQSQDFSTSWTTTQATVSTDVAVAPDGKTTVDGLVATAVTTQHGVAQNEIDLTADSYVLHVWAEPGDQDWLYLDVSTVANATVYFNIATGFVGTTGAGIDDSGIESAWGNFYHAWIVFTGTVAQHTFCVYSAEADGDNQFLGDASTINTYVWQAQVELGTFPTTIIPTTTVPVTRNADSVTLDPHPAGKPEARALPEKFSPNTPADKLTVYFEAKCEWSGSADIGTERQSLEISGFVGTASNTRNRLRFQVYGTGRIETLMRDDADNDHQILSAIDVVDYSEWFSVRTVLDFSDFSRIDMWINDSNVGMTYVGNSGTGSFDTADTLIRIGQLYAGAVYAFCRTRNPRITPTEVRAP